LICELSISRVEYIAEDLIDLYKILNAYELLPENMATYYQPVFA